MNKKTNFWDFAIEHPGVIIFILYMVVICALVISGS